MTAIAEERLIEQFGLGVKPQCFTLEVAAATSIKKGAMVGIDPTGYAKPADTTCVKVVGVAFAAADNSAGLAGAKTVQVQAGTFLEENSASGDAITNAHRGQIVYVVDDQTVALTPDTGRLPAGRVAHVNASGVFVTMGDEAELGGILKFVKTITHADLTDADGAQVIAVTPVLPPGATLLGREIAITTLFSGGSASAVTMALGGTDADGIATATDVFTGATGFPKAGTGGAEAGAGQAHDFGGQTIAASFAVTGDTCAALTAGSTKVTLFFAV